jgi:hypothetical protein
MGFLRRTVPDKQAESVDLSALALESMRRAGADPAVPHQTRHFLYVPGVKAAQEIARALRNPQRRIEIETSARTGYWLVVVRQSMLITPEAMAALRLELETAARPFGGEYDRWQVEIAGG